MGTQLILTHENTDFDALASQLAAWKLYPQALPVLPRRPNRNLRDFLALYGDELPFLSYKDLPRRVELERIVLVDTQTLVTPRGMTPETVLQIVDHHPLCRELPPNWSFSGGDTGATTTLLLEWLIAAGLNLSPVEATLLALGIYEDTGSLAYPTTTVRDLRCVTWLAEHGANLTVLGEYLHPALTQEQLALYDALLGQAEVLDFAGRTIVVASASGQGQAEEIATLAHKIRDLYDAAGLFLLVGLGENVQMVARSTNAAVDVGHIARHLGGGGHNRAAAALLRGEGLETTRARLMSLLQLHIQPPVTVAQIMSHGVHTLPPETTVQEAAEAMLKYGFEGFPVVGAEGQVLGILTRREIDRATRLRLDDMPVSQAMTKGAICVGPDDSVETLQHVMTRFGVGQVPVARKGEIIGVVTRTDLIKLWAAPAQPPPRRQEIASKIERALPPLLLDLLRLVSEAAEEMGFPLYVVGGFVRDLLLGEPILDMDLVVEGDAIKLAHKVARQVGAGTRSHERFGTAKILLEGREAEFGVSSLDLATARMEFYPHTAALPEVERSSIKADLHRRDFTINTLAVRLDSAHFGELLDSYGGEHDLTDRAIRVLHSLSFIEDPTRIMRAARFEQRLGFAIEPRTVELIDNALPMLARVSGERIRHELYLILREREPERALARLDGLHVLPQLHPRLVGLDKAWELFGRLRALLAEGVALTLPSSNRAGEVASPGSPIPVTAAGQRWRVPAEEGRPAPGLYLALLVHTLARPDVEAFAGRVRIYRNDLDLLRQVLDLRERETQLDAPVLMPSQVDALLHRSSSPALLIAWLCAGSERVRERLWLYEATLRHVEPVIDGRYLMGLGLKPSPLFSKLLRAVRAARLDGLIQSEAEERTIVEHMLAGRKTA